MKAVLVTGATGFIGRHVVRRLRSEGVSVCGLSRRGGVVEDVLVDTVDLSDGVQLRAWWQGKDFQSLIHLASEIPARVMGPVAEECFKSNVLAMINVLRLANRIRCHVVYSSGVSVYGTLPREDVPLTEGSLPKPDNYYFTSKYVGELLCEQQAKNMELSYTILRFSAPYGPGNHRHTVVNVFLGAAIESKDLILYGSGARAQDFIYVDDVVEAVWLALLTHAPGTFNIVSEMSISMKVLAEYVLEIVPSSSSQIVCSGKPDPQEDYRGLFSAEKAHRELGWAARVGMVRGLRSTAEWLRQGNSAC